MSYLAALAVTFLVCVLLVCTQRWHGRLSMDSTMGVQKFHTHPTPRVGGIAIVLGFVAATGLSEPQVRAVLQPLFIAGIPAFVAGLTEDITKRVGVKPRLVATMCSGVLAWYLTGVAMRHTDVPGLDWLLAYTPVAVLFTAFAVGGVANAVNIIDGFNGLAAGAVAIMFAAMAYIASDVGDPPLAAASLTLAATAIGFGMVNWPFGKIFLGDGGAYFLGFALAWIAVLLPMRNPAVNAWATLLVCAYPVLEVAFSYHRKSMREGHHPGQPDKVHLHMLVYRRIAKPLFRGKSRAFQNGMTSPFAWAYAAIPATWAAVFAKSTPMLIIGLLTATLAYSLVYVRLTQFRWSFSPTSKLQDLLAKLASRNTVLKAAEK